MLKNSKFIKTAVCTLFFLMLIVYIGPMDSFTYGYFSDEIDCGQIAEEDYLGNIDLGTNDFDMVFSPQKPHFAGFELYLNNQPEGNSGNIIMTIFDESGKMLDAIIVDLSKVYTATWYKVYTKAKLKQGRNYILSFTTDDCDIAPWLQTVNNDYLPDETISGNVLISYAYKNSTFTFQNKVIFFMFIIAIWMFICGNLFDGKIKLYSRTIAGIIFMSSVLTWNYMYNSMDNQNETFVGFQADSETYVTGPIYAERDGMHFRMNDKKDFGLGRYYNLKGNLSSYDLKYITDGDWLDGYSKTESAVIVNSNIYSKSVAVPGNYVKFKNGEAYSIMDVNDEGGNIVIYLDSRNVLSSAKHGSLDDAIFYDNNYKKLPSGLITTYISQYGLQGKAFRYLARYMDEEQMIYNLNLFCCIATAVVFAIIVSLLFIKYNGIMAGCFFVTFWLSPWIVNFARNLYWVEFSWFIPMAIGLFCAWKIDSRKCRIASYILTLLAVAGKCLCGYEYISVIMMGLISFLLVDLILSLLKKDKRKSILLFRTVLFLGIMALIGFILAIYMHALLRGGGNVINGIKDIFVQDVLRRTNGVDLNNYGQIAGRELYALTASIWETYCLYFHFQTEVIAGINGNLFPLLCIVPLCGFGYEYSKKKLNYELVAMYVVFFFTSISWFCLAKSHSYVHIHMNYVLWYFGFVQICLYIILNKIVSLFENIKINKKEDEKL